jgi:hypothetical protein
MCDIADIVVKAKLDAARVTSPAYVHALRAAACLILLETAGRPRRVEIDVELLFAEADAIYALTKAARS